MHWLLRVRRGREACHFYLVMGLRSHIFWRIEGRNRPGTSQILTVWAVCSSAATTAGAPRNSTELRTQTRYRRDTKARCTSRFIGFFGMWRSGANARPVLKSRRWLISICGWAATSKNSGRFFRRFPSTSARKAGHCSPPSFCMDRERRCARISSDWRGSWVRIQERTTQSFSSKNYAVSTSTGGARRKRRDPIEQNTCGIAKGPRHQILRLHHKGVDNVVRFHGGSVPPLTKR